LARRLHRPQRYWKDIYVNDAVLTDRFLPGLLALPAHERILAAARDLFCRHGIHATGIDKILSSASASKMTLYSHFGSKDALLRQVLLREGADWRASFFSAVQAAESPERQLRSVISATAGWYRGGRFFGCAFMNAIAEHDKGELWLREIAAEHHAIVLAFLSELAREAGYSEPKILSRQLLLLIDGATAALMVTGDETVITIAERNLAAILASAVAVADQA